MPTISTACAICDSPLREQIEKLDSQWKDIHTVQWARKQGLNISRFSLLKHRTNHLQPVQSGDNGNGANAVKEPDQVVTLKPLDLKSVEASKLQTPERGKRQKKTTVKSESASSVQILEAERPVIAPIESTAKPADPVHSGEQAAPTKLPVTISDQLLLDTVRDKVYQKLLDGEIKLDLGDGFKAIEIKHKIGEESQTEKLLLEILNEIRSQELTD
jgi:hypothetical protein